LKDVARVEFGSYTYTAANRVDGKPVAGFAIMQTAGSNANEILTEIEKQVDQFKTTLPKGVNRSSCTILKISWMRLFIRLLRL
jgi:multidrug efflux pump subunit AcrB